MVAYLGHSSLYPELSQFIVPKLIWPSSGTFQHHRQLSTSEDTASCLLGRLDTHQRASLCGQLEFVSRTSLIGGQPTTILSLDQANVRVCASETVSIKAEQWNLICFACPSVSIFGNSWERFESARVTVVAYIEDCGKVSTLSLTEKVTSVILHFSESSTSARV